MNLILASASPRRQQILAEMGLPFDVLVTHADETVDPQITSPREVCAEIARKKAAAAAEIFAEDYEGEQAVIIAADTIVQRGGKIYGKPDGELGALQMLTELSGGEHSVITAMCIAVVTQNGTIFLSDIGETFVTFRALSESEISDYAFSGEPLDKSGSYAIQGGAAAFVEKIEGDIGNVIGLSEPRLRTILEKIGIANL